MAHAFHGLPGVRVVVLYPLGRVSPRQEAQFASLGGNVTAVAVRGAFDDCQRLARQAFADPVLTAKLRLTSANSINIGRLLPQTFYHVHALMEAERLASTARHARRRTPPAEHGERPGAHHVADPASPQIIVSVPSGNFGNLTAGLIAHHLLAMPEARFVAATNANSVVPDYLAGHGYRPRPSTPTLSSAMDVGDPSNFRRMVHLFGNDPGARRGAEPDAPAGDPPHGRQRRRPADPLRVRSRPLRRLVAGSSWTDDQTRRCIRDLWRRTGIAIDPHTAVGLLGLRREMKRTPGATGVVLATAHPAKFAETVEPIIGESLPVPPGIRSVMDRPIRAIPIAARLDALRDVLARLDSQNVQPAAGDHLCCKHSTNATAT